MLAEFLLLSIAASFVIYVSIRGKKVHKRKDKLLQAKQNRIKEIRLDDKLYDVTDWVDRHPGGKIIEFYTNKDEDASIAIQQFHNRSTNKVLAILKSFKSRPVPEQTAVVAKDLRNQNLTQDFYNLFKELKDEGLFEPSLVYTTLRIFELIGLCVLGMALVLQSDNIALKGIGLFLLCLYHMRAGFLMHESGHFSLTGSPKADRILTSLILGIPNGLSGSWWRNQHNRHHAMPQRLDHDVDLNTLPAIAFNAKVLKGRTHLLTFWIRHQAKLMVPIVAFGGHFRWKLHLNPIYAFDKREFVDLVAIAIHCLYVYQIGFVNYMFAASFYSSFMLITFSISHSHLPVTEEPTHWLEYCTIHTINVNPSWWCDYWMGYLNYQIEHHMFPSMPQFRLRRISGRVKALVEKHDLPYECYSYATAFGKLFGNLAAVAKNLVEQSRLAKMDGKKDDQ